MPANATAWVCALGVGAERLRDAARKSLRAAGVDARVLDGQPPTGCGIVFFDSAAGPVAARIGELAQAGADRMLAVPTERSALTGETSWRLLAAGASDVVAYDSSPWWAKRVAARIARWNRVEELASSAAVRDRLIGESARWRASVRSAVEAAHFTDAPVLVTGETGTGKELVARLIHSLDARRAKRELVVVDCTTVVPTLSGSEFFGHERGAFTGAVARREGAFALADTGTLFLDEVGELPLGLQSELLRVVQEGVYKRVGGNDWHRTSFRLVCATNRDLAAEAAAGRFRHDLLYRIAGSTLRLPSLRERREDILPLARHFLRDSAGDDEIELDGTVEDVLRSREYPGNVRDLRQLALRIGYRHVGPGPVTIGELPEDERVVPETAVDWRDDGFSEAIRSAVARGATLREIGTAATDSAISVALAEEGGNLQRAARRLGLTPRALQLRRAAGKLPAPS
ncbi:MAG TPA: sigma 54-interacting transcriptional regulator [Gaiellaceae bacterium]